MPAPLTVLVTAVGCPGTTALVRALREHGERPVRVVGTDMQREVWGAFACDGFALVPAGSDPGFADALLDVALREGASVVIPQTSYDLPGLAAARDRFAAAGVRALVPSAADVRRADSKRETLAVCARLGVRHPAFIEAQGGEAVLAAARALGYPDVDVCMKPVTGAGSRGFRVLSAHVDKRHELLHARPGALPLRAEEAAEIIGDDATELLVMELVTGGERTVDGYAEGGRIVVGHAKTREAMRAGLAMRFETLDAPELMDVATRVVGDLRIDGFFNLQLVGDAVIEINPRISTVVYQDDYNLPWLGVRRALGELTDAEAAAAQARIRPGRVAVRYYDQLEYDLPARG